jgi:putative methyltransferase (TIGR04325 family)
VRKILHSPLVKGVARWANREPFIWDGIYENFAQVPSLGDGFASDVWLSETQRYTQAAVMALRNNRGEIPENVAPYHVLFSVLVASLSLERPVRVVDYGGGIGIGFASLRRSIRGQAAVEYLVVDNEQSCERGRQLFADFPKVRFTSELPRAAGVVDVLVLSSVLQFVENYEALLSELAGLGPRFWMFTFVPAGDIPTFATAQLNVPGSILPAWFFNVRELVEKVEALGYGLLFKSALDRVFDMSNFPPTHQLKRHCNLLFRHQ